MDEAGVLLLGGRAGVGKTTVAWEVSVLLRTASVPHAVVEGDFMGQIHPAPAGDPRRTEMTERNLTAVWGNFAERGCRRLVYTNTASVLPEATGMFERAMGPAVRITRVLLTATDATARTRLTGRERGSELEHELAAGLRNARLPDQRSAPGTVRVATDGRSVVDLARAVVAATGWTGDRLTAPDRYGYGYAEPSGHDRAWYQYRRVSSLSSSPPAGAPQVQRPARGSMSPAASRCPASRSSTAS